MGRIRFAVVVAAVLFAIDARAAGEPPIGIGEVSAGVSSRDVDLDVLRAMVTEAVGTLDASTLPRGSAAVLSVSVVRLEARSASPAEVTCLVSATLRDRRRGTVFAVMEGSARGQDEPRRLPALERAILRAAVSSAVARVPEAMRRRAR
ncbi:MAG TPA: hypothetical protein VGL81_30270 [Polyangiaceae bacterium]